MYTNQDKLKDAVAGTVLVAGFILLWSAAAIVDLATVGY